MSEFGGNVITGLVFVKMMLYLKVIVLEELKCMLDNLFLQKKQKALFLETSNTDLGEWLAIPE